MVSIILFLSLKIWGQDQVANLNGLDEVKPVVEVVEPSQIQEFLAPFFYDKDKFRDPFETQGSGSPLNPGQVYGPFLALQTFRLNDFQLKGLMWNTDKPVAVFKAPNGKEYRLKVKDYIGENFGYIASIREKEVVVIQTIEEDSRRYSTTKVVFLQSKTE